MKTKKHSICAIILVLLVMVTPAYAGAKKSHKPPPDPELLQSIQKLSTCAHQKSCYIADLVAALLDLEAGVANNSALGEITGGVSFTTMINKLQAFARQKSLEAEKENSNNNESNEADEDDDMYDNPGEGATTDTIGEIGEAFGETPVSDAGITSDNILEIVVDVTEATEDTLSTTLEVEGEV